MMDALRIAALYARSQPFGLNWVRNPLWRGLPALSPSTAAAASPGGAVSSVPPPRGAWPGRRAVLGACPPRCGPAVERSSAPVPASGAGGCRERAAVGCGGLQPSRGQRPSATLPVPHPASPLWGGAFPPAPRAKGVRQRGRAVSGPSEQMGCAKGAVRAAPSPLQRFALLSAELWRRADAWRMRSGCRVNARWKRSGCTADAWQMQGGGRADAWWMHGGCTAFAWGCTAEAQWMHGGCVAVAQQMHSRCRADAWRMHSGCTADAWQMHSKCTADAGRMHGGCTVDAQRMHSECMVDAWQLHSECMADAWQTHSGCRTGAGRPHSGRVAAARQKHGG
ncbi:uncharacterized protein LOC142412746 [Mycteria americana]|uniref:uncharacterized protein LOC142412746 n=1 Tax=Mycteria americana TaxID=33587 RepID=UPI003F58EEC3